MIKIGVIGLGNMGRRHIQSIASMPEEKEIFCYDIFDSSFGLLKDFLEDNCLSIPHLKFFDNLQNFLDHIDKNSIVIVATTAKGRANLLKKIAYKKPKAILSEKPVCQTLKEYYSLLELKGCPIYINFFRHHSPDHIKLCNKLYPLKIQDIKMELNNGGLACNGIHMIDWIIWILNSKEYKLLDINISVPYESKRESFYDFAGHIRLKINNINCEISLDFNKPTECVTIKTEGAIYYVYEPWEKFVEKSKSSNKTSKFITPLQSQLSSEIIKAIFHGNCLLPDISLAFISHKILFEVMERGGISNLNIT